MDTQTSNCNKTQLFAVAVCVRVRAQAIIPIAVLLTGRYHGAISWFSVRPRSHNQENSHLLSSPCTKSTNDDDECQSWRCWNPSISSSSYSAQRSELFVTYVPSSPSSVQHKGVGSNWFLFSSFFADWIILIQFVDVLRRNVLRNVCSEKCKVEIFPFVTLTKRRRFALHQLCWRKKKLNSSILLILEFRRLLSKSSFAGFLASCFYLFLFFVIFNYFASFARPLPWGRHHHRRAQLIRENIGKHIILLPCIGWFSKHRLQWELEGEAEL